MREIKFRAWNEREEDGTTTFIKGFCEAALIMRPDGKLWFAHHVGMDCRSRDDYPDLPWFLPEEEGLTIEFYTGLKDKNGKEIYEGDIVKDQKGQHGRIFWRDKGVGWGVTWQMNDGSWETDDWINEIIEIIGNIHENGELLKP